MGNFKEEIKGVQITEEERKKLSPEELARLEQYLKELREQEFPDVKLTDPEKFDAKGMKPANHSDPVRWHPIKKK